MATARTRGAFGVVVTFTQGRALLAVVGELDLATAPELAAVLSAVIDRGHDSVVLNLAGLDFMGAAGLRIIQAAAGRLDALGGTLSIQAPSNLVRRLLDLTGMAKGLSVEAVDDDHGQLGPEQTDATPLARTLEPANLTSQFRRVTSIPADNDVVDGALRLVVALARATVGGADGVSVSLNRHGRLATVAASDQTILDMDADQYATGEGPCVDASVTGRWFHAKSLEQETRWPAFTPRARNLGIRAILSTPLLSEDRPVGALNIYSRTSSVFAAEEQELAAMFATEASVILRDAGVDVTEGELSLRLAEALRTRQVIAQAQGVLMERDSIDEREAYTRLRSASQHSNQPLRERAAYVVGSAARPPPAPPTDGGRRHG